MDGKFKFIEMFDENMHFIFYKQYQSAKFEFYTL